MLHNWFFSSSHAYWNCVAENVPEKLIFFLLYKDLLLQTNIARTIINRRVIECYWNFENYKLVNLFFPYIWKPGALPPTSSSSSLIKSFLDIIRSNLKQRNVYFKTSILIHSHLCCVLISFKYGKFYSHIFHLIIVRHFIFISNTCYFAKESYSKVHFFFRNECVQWHLVQTIFLRAFFFENNFSKRQALK